MTQENKDITNTTLVKETPVVSTQTSAEADGYISATTISFTFVDEACTINDSGSGFGSGKVFDTSEAGEKILVSSTSGLNDGIYTLYARTSTAVLTLGSTDVVTTESANEAGTVVITGVQIYEITPTKHMSKLCVLVVEGSGLAGMIMSVLPGTHWAGKETLYVDMENVITISRVSYIFVETAPYVQADGTIHVMLRPVAGSELTSDHSPTVGFLQLP